jgi:hypothetical protein
MTNLEVLSLLENKYARTFIGTPGQFNTKEVKDAILSLGITSSIIIFEKR